MDSKFNQEFKSLANTIKTIALSKEIPIEIIQWGEIYGRFLYTNHSTIYRDDDFENILSSKYNTLVEKSTKPIKNCIHVLSEAYTTGGHTRLLERLFLGGLQGDILITQNKSSSSLKGLNIEDTIIYEEFDGFEFENIYSILKDYKNIYLYLHPNDLKAFVAAGLCRRDGVKVIMINHADHVFSFGFNSVDEIAEVSLYGLKVTKERRNLESGFIGIPLMKSSFSRTSSEYSRCLKLLSGATSLKYKPTKDQSFPRFTSNLIKNSKNINITIIGPNIVKDHWWWLAKLKCGKRLTIRKKLSYTEYLETLEDADVYVDSFPMTGGTALAEVRSNGIPIAGLSCGSSGYSPFDLLKSESEYDLVQDLLEYQKNILRSRLGKLNNDNDLLELASKVHDKSKVVERLKMLTFSSIKEDAYLDNHAIDVDFYSRSWETDQALSFGKQLYSFFFTSWNEGGKEVIHEYLKTQEFYVRLKYLLLAFRYYVKRVIFMSKNLF